MGQYYNVYVERENGRVDVFDKTVDNQFTPNKLMEWSWWQNKFATTLAKMLYKNPARVACVGDYSDDTDWYRIEEIYPLVWGENANARGVEQDSLLLDGKYLVNHDQKTYVDCDAYYKRSNRSSLGDGWVAHPIPLLTAVGNGLGGGDYNGVNEADIGAWYLELISVEDEIPEGYTEEDFTFYESWD